VSITHTHTHGPATTPERCVRLRDRCHADDADDDDEDDEADDNDSDDDDAENIDGPDDSSSADARQPVNSLAYVLTRYGRPRRENIFRPR